MATLERILRDKNFNKEFSLNYKHFELDKQECRVRRLFGFSRKELFILGHEKLKQLAEITKDFSDVRIKSKYVERLFKNYYKTLIDNMIEQDSMYSKELISQIHDAYSETLKEETICSSQETVEDKEPDENDFFFRLLNRIDNL